MSTKEQSAEAEGMLDVAELRKIYAEKLAATDSLDAAFLKAVWVAFKRGIAVATPGPRRCEYCDDSGHVHRAGGEWLGCCTCETGKTTPLICEPDPRNDFSCLTSDLCAVDLYFAEAETKGGA